MGLPMWRLPEEAEDDTQGAKLEKVAGLRRSAIRRETSIRPHRMSRAQWSNVNQQHAEQTYRVLRRTHLALERESRQIQHLEAELERLRRNRVRTRAQVELDDENEAVTDPAVRAGVPTSRIRETLLPAPLEPHMSQSLRPSSSLRMIESERPRSASHGSSSPRRYRSSRRPYIPSPPYSSDSRRSPEATMSRRDTIAELTPNFAPAQGPYPPGPEVVPGVARLVVEHRMSEDDDMPSLETPPAEEYESSYAPLRRVSHLSPPPGRATLVRMRSLSPHPSDSNEEDTWETLLTTMDSTDGSSTTQNSFTSNSSESAGRSGRSSQTTGTSFGEIGQLDDACDLDLPQGITEELARELRARHHRDEHVRSQDDREESRMRDMEAHARRITRQTISSLLSSDQPMLQEIRRSMSNIEEREATLGALQVILRMMQQREEVPQELWAAAGVSPVVWENVRDVEREATARPDPADG